MPVPYSVCGKCRQAYELGETCGCAPETSEPLANEPGIGDAKVMGIDWGKADGSSTVTWERHPIHGLRLVDENRNPIPGDQQQEIARAMRGSDSIKITSFELLDDPNPERPSRVRVPPHRAGVKRELHWLDRIEALRPGEECEVQSNADAQWYRGIVKHNGGAGFWVVEVLGDRWYRHIEQVRCVGQTEAWT